MNICRSACFSTWDFYFFGNSGYFWVLVSFGFTWVKNLIVFKWLGQKYGDIDFWVWIIFSMRFSSIWELMLLFGFGFIWVKNLSIFKKPSMKMLFFQSKWTWFHLYFFKFRLRFYLNWLKKSMNVNCYA